MKFTAVYPSPIGTLHCVIENNTCVEVLLPFASIDNISHLPAQTLPHELKLQLDQYFSGTLVKPFTLLSTPQGTDFQQRVWQAIYQIPYGETRTYSDLAKALQSHPRAIGQACGKNPIPILIPCHRVIAKNGLGGFALSTETSNTSIKTALLRLEGAL